MHTGRTDITWSRRERIAPKYPRRSEKRREKEKRWEQRTEPPPLPPKPKGYPGWLEASRKNCFVGPPIKDPSACTSQINYICKIYLADDNTEDNYMNSSLLISRLNGVEQDIKWESAQYLMEWGEFLGEIKYNSKKAKEKYWFFPTNYLWLTGYFTLKDECPLC